MTPETAAIAANVTPVLAKGTIALFVALLIRDMIWKGIGLWKAGTKKQLTRFICIFIFNTLGLLPIIYLAFFQKKEKGKK